MLLSFACLSRYARQPGWASAALAGAAIGITTSLKYNGILLLAPSVIALGGRAGRHLPLPARLALRANHRSQGRSAAVVAALTLALGIPTAIAVVTASLDTKQADEPRNLPAHQAILWIPGAEEEAQDLPADTDPAIADVAALVGAALPAATVIPLEAAVPDDATPARYDFERIGPAEAVTPVFGLRPAREACNCDLYAFGDRAPSGEELVFTGHDAWVARPDLLAALGTEQVESDGSDNGLALARWGDAVLSTHRSVTTTDGAGSDLVEDLPPEGSLAPVLIKPEAVDANGWSTLTVGWLVDNPAPLTGAERDSISAITADQLVPEVRVEPEPRTALRFIAVAVGGVLAVGILISSVVLATSEAGGDRRVLAAIGASPGVGRRLVASGAVALAAAGALLAVPLGYLALVPLVAIPDEEFPFVVPIATLAAVLVGLPVAAAGVGWLGGGRPIGPLTSGADR